MLDNLIKEENYNSNILIRIINVYSTGKNVEINFSFANKLD